MDPFATPANSRPPSVVAQETTSTNYVPRRSILVQSGFGSSAFSSSARLSIARVSSNGQVNAAPSGNTQPAKSKVPRMKSHMLNHDEPIQKPWLEKKNPRATFSYWIVYAIILIGIAGGAVQSYFRYKSVPLDKQPLCLVFEEDFNDEQKVFGTDPTKGGSFFREVGMDGFGNGEFEMTTSSSNNSFVQNGHLFLNPTLTSQYFGSDNPIYDATIFNLTDCTFNLTAPDSGYITSPTTGQRVFDQASYLNACSKVSNKTTGAVINPAMSARISTRFSASIRYGRVEVRAKMPNGYVFSYLRVSLSPLTTWFSSFPCGPFNRHFQGLGKSRPSSSTKIPISLNPKLWPAIWMLPKDSAYGAWPRSGESKSTILPFILSLTHLSLTGEIDIVESRGNSIRYTGQGSNYVQGSLNWGPSPSLNSVSKTYSWWTDKRHSFGSDFHTYALEWTEKFIRIYVDSRLQTLLEIRFDKQSFFERGAYPDVIFNGSSIEPLKNPWAGGNNASPFDKGGLGCFFCFFIHTYVPSSS